MPIESPVGFRSLAEAQSELVNSTVRFFERGLERPVALSWRVAPSRPFCSFEADDANTSATLSYLRELDSRLHPSVSLLWNGPGRLSRQISLDYAKTHKGLVKRDVILWERAPLKGSRLRDSYLLAPYQGRSAELGCFYSGILLSIGTALDDSWKPLVSSALQFSYSPADYDADNAFKAAVSETFGRDAIEAASAVVDATPSGLYKETISPPGCLRSHTKEETAYFSRVGALSASLAKPFAPWRVAASYAVQFAQSNQLFASFELAGRKIDEPTRAALTKSLRAWARRLEPVHAAIRPLKTSLFKHQIPEKAFVQEIQSNFFKWDQLVSAPKSAAPALNLRAPSLVTQTLKTLEEVLYEDLCDLEGFLFQSYNDADLESMRDYLNSLHFGFASKDTARPGLTTAPTKVLNTASLDSFQARLAARRAAAAKLIASTVATQGGATPQESEKTVKIEIAGVPGLIYWKNWLSAADEEKLLKDIDAHPWNSVLSRRTQQYGYVYDYGAVAKQSVDESRLSMAQMLPASLQALADRLFKEKICPIKPDQCIVNEYKAGQGINPHIDHTASFQDCIVSISLGSDVVMDFKSLERGDSKPVLLNRRSAVVLSGDARYRWQHGIAQREVDQIDGREIVRGRRVSITFRKVSAQAISAITKTKRN